MSAHVLLNLLNKYGKRDKMQGLLWVLSGPPGFTCWIYFAPIFSFMYS